MEERILREKVDLEWLKNRLKSHFNYIGGIKHFIESFQPGDECWHWKTSPASWTAMCGQAGFAQIRNNNYIQDIVLHSSFGYYID